MKKGWAKIENVNTGRQTARYHYFKEGASLCGKYIITGSGDFIDENWTPTFDKCQKCLELWEETKE